MFVFKSKLSHVPWCLRAWLIASRLIRKLSLFPVPSALHFLLSYLLTLAGPQGPNPHNLEAISKLKSRLLFGIFLWWVPWPQMTPILFSLPLLKSCMGRPKVSFSSLLFSICCSLPSPNTLQSVVNKWSLLSSSCCLHWTGSFNFQEIPLLFSWQQKLRFVSYYYLSFCYCLICRFLLKLVFSTTMNSHIMF